MAFSAMQKRRRSGQKRLSTIAATSVVAGGSLLPIFPAAAITSCTASDLNSLQAHAADINCDIINVTSNINFSEGDYRIVVTHDVLIQGSVTIDANSYGEHFIIADDYDGTSYAGDINSNGALDVTLKNLTLREGYAFADSSYFSYSRRGGAITHGIYSTEVNLTLDSVDFIENDADLSGGAVYIRTGFIEIKNGSTFTNNQAEYGGAINIVQGTNPDIDIPFYFPTSDEMGLLISGDALFSYNAASDGDGGAIWATTGIVISGEVTFDHNGAQSDGGAIAGLTTVISKTGDVTFNENIAGGMGGAIGYTFMGEGLIEDESLIWVQGDATFTENVAAAGGAVAVWALFGIGDSHLVFEDNRSLAESGGAVAAFGVVLGAYGGAELNEQITVAEFTNNSSAENGGAIWAPIIISDPNNSLSFIGNESYGDGGAIFTYGFGAPYQVSNAYFGHNTAGGNGGAISAIERVFVHNSTFFNNSAGLEGGAIFTDNDNSEVILSTFVDNQAPIVDADSPGQSIYSSGTFKLFGNIFASTTSNHAQLGEGGSGGPEFIDLGANLSTSINDENELTHDKSLIVDYAALTLAAAPSIESGYPRSTPTIQISTDSAAADIIDLQELEASIAQLNFGLGDLPTFDQRGVSRTLRYDAGAYEAGDSTYRSIAPILEIINKVVLPTAPARVAVRSAGKAAFYIEWPMPTTPGTGKIIGYEIYRNGKKIATVSSNTRKYRDTKLDPNQSYTYRIVTIATQGKSIKSISSPSLFPKK